MSVHSVVSQENNGPSGFSLECDASLSNTSDMSKKAFEILHQALQDAFFNLHQRRKQWNKVPFDRRPVINIGSTVSTGSISKAELSVKSRLDEAKSYFHRVRGYSNNRVTIEPFIQWKGESITVSHYDRYWCFRLIKN